MNNLRTFMTISLSGGDFPVGMNSMNIGYLDYVKKKTKQ